MRKALASLPRTVWLLGAISLLNDAASDMIYPLVPLYVASVLMAGPKALGWIEGVAEAASSLLKLFSGALADRMRRIKPFVVAGAMESGRFRADTLIDTAPGSMRVGIKTIQDKHNLGTIDVTTVLAKSSNVGVVKIALTMKPEEM